MILNAIFCKSTKEILYSRSQHDYISSSDKSVSVDGGFSYMRVIGDHNNYISMQLDGDVLLEMILSYDFAYCNYNADKFPKGYYGRFEIVENSNPVFYKKLVMNFDDIKQYFKED